MDSFSGDIAAVSRIDVVPKILDVVCRATGMGFAAVARVTGDRWIACAVQDNVNFGLVPGGELEVKTTICDEIRQHGRSVIIDHVAESDAFRDHHTPAQYGLQSYISVPIMVSGKFFGTLCAIDPNPHVLDTPQTRGMFELFAEMIAYHLEAEQRLAETSAALLSAKEAAELREQFIAVLGHDLRNPLASVNGGLRLMRKTPLNERAVELAGLMDKSVARMAELIDNVLDFARGRLGGGIEVGRHIAPGLGEMLMQVVAELRTAHPGRAIETHISLGQLVNCDSQRIGQLFSNLLANALTHGRPDGPVVVRAVSGGGAFELSVSNPSDTIPPETMARLFLPFARVADSPSQAGLGLGLYIAHEIARAHHGDLSATSADGVTTFTLSMPAEG